MGENSIKKKSIWTYLDSKFPCIQVWLMTKECSLLRNLLFIFFYNFFHIFWTILVASIPNLNVNFPLSEYFLIPYAIRKKVLFFILRRFHCFTNIVSSRLMVAFLSIWSFRDSTWSRWCVWCACVCTCACAHARVFKTFLAFNKTLSIYLWSVEHLGVHEINDNPSG